MFSEMTKTELVEVNGGGGGLIIGAILLIVVGLSSCSANCDE